MYLCVCVCVLMYVGKCVLNPNRRCRRRPPLGHSHVHRNQICAQSARCSFAFKHAASNMCTLSSRLPRESSPHLTNRAYFKQNVARRTDRVRRSAACATLTPLLCQCTRKDHLRRRHRRRHPRRRCRLKGRFCLCGIVFSVKIGEPKSSSCLSAHGVPHTVYGVQRSKCNSA